MKLPKDTAMRFSFLCQLAIAMLLTAGTTDAQVVTFNFNGDDSTELDDVGIGGFQTATADDDTEVTLTTTDVTGIVDDGAGGFALESLAENPMAGHTVCVRPNQDGQVGICSAVDGGFTGAVNQFNPGESWTFVLDQTVRFDSLDLQSFDDATENNQFTITAGDESLVFNQNTFPDDAPDVEFTTFNGDTEFIVAAGTEITFAASSFDPALAFNESSEFRIPDFTLTIVSSSILLGDVDLSGTVDFLDIAPFISVLSNGGSQAEADVDESGTVDFLDIAPFIGILSGS